MAPKRGGLGKGLDLIFMENETDNLDPEGLDMLRLTNNDTTIFLNPYIHSNFYKKYAFLF